AENALVGARRLKALIEDFTDVAAKHEEVRACERRGDEVTTEIIRRLSTSFVTPFDREDIHALAEELDDVVDDILAVSDLLNLVQVDRIIPELDEQADVLVRACEENVALIIKFREMRGVQGHLDAI